MAATIIRVGDIGSGHAAKALNNLVSAATMSITVEALVLAEAFGITADTMTRVLNSSSGRSNTSENKVAQFMTSGSFDSGFSLRLMAKDVGLAIGLARALDQPLRSPSTWPTSGTASRRGRPRPLTTRSCTPCWERRSRNRRPVRRDERTAAALDRRGVRYVRGRSHPYRHQSVDGGPGTQVSLGTAADVDRRSGPRTAPVPGGGT